MIRRIHLVRQLWHCFGLGWLTFRVRYAVRMRSGLLRRQIPAYAWTERPLQTWLKPSVPSAPDAYAAWRKAQSERFFFETLLPSSQAAVDEAEALLAGQWRYFEHLSFDMGFPPDWHVNPLTGQRAPADRHWSQISDFDHGDIKFIWEPSRFAAAYLLVRAYAVSRDERYPEAFWHLVEDWARQNPPNQGPNWKCGQETALRVMALCWGLYGFAASPHTTPERTALLATLIAAQAERIDRNIAFARSLKNNHAISEAVGLWTVGLLFPEFKQSEHWRQVGQRVLEQEIQRQIYADGSYVQHSMNYHRLMLHDVLWAGRLGEINGQRLPDTLYRAANRALTFLYQVTDPESGGVPNCGGNDGALILPLNTCDYLDFRPVLQAVHYWLHGERLFPPGPWDEDVTWLFGRAALPPPPAPAAPPAPLSAAEGGYYTLRGKQSWLMVRCAHYRDRPAHADQLHVDLWWQGKNITLDPGSYLYNGPAPWANGLAAAAVHNTVTVDAQDPMTRAGRFLWLDWAQGRVLYQQQTESGELAYWEGTHTGYERLNPPVTHRRGIVHLGSDRWLVLDALHSSGEHTYTLHWLLADHLPYTPQTGSISGTGVNSLVCADPTGIRGWHSPYYGMKEPARSITLTERGRSVCFWTLFDLGTSDITVQDHTLSIHGTSWETSIQLGLSDHSPVAHTISLTGTDDDILVIQGRQS